MSRFLLALALSLIPVVAIAQQPVPLYPGAAPRSIEPETLPPLPTAPSAAPQNSVPSPASAPPAPKSAPGAPATAEQRVFCGQSLGFHLAHPERVPARYREFVGIFSDAAWTPSLCAALVVENVGADGTATIAYAYGPMSADARGGGVLHGTGVVRDGELRFQNSDGSQFAFRLVYADLDGRLTTPKGQTYEAMFKRTPP